MTGINPGMVMQRNSADVCEITIESGQPPREATYHGALEEGTISAEACGNGRYRLRGVPVGGPYTVKLDGQTYEDIYVGDVWVLGGQSNMEGVGWLTAEDELFRGDPEVRAFYMEDAWGVARHPLHDLGRAVDGVHAALGGVPRPMFNSVGPGLTFALKMKALTGVPQGVLCCGHGGTSMEQWSPAIKDRGGDGSLYGAMLRRVRVNGAHVRGMFWYQGCSDAGYPMCDLFVGRMIDFAAECRRDFDCRLPFVQVQIGRVTGIFDQGAQDTWSAIREHQRELYKSVADLSTVSAIAKPLDDLIHISRDGQHELGTEAAEAMYHLLYGTDSHGCLPPPRYDGHMVRADEKSGMAVLALRYRSLHGPLTAGSRPFGFTVMQPEGPPAAQLIFDTRLKGDTVELRLQATPQEIAGCRLYYGYGTDPYCNITDSAGRSIPAMGPVRL